MAKQKPTAFAKIAAEGKIQAYSCGDRSSRISVRTGPLTDADRARLHRMLDEEATVRVTIELVEKGRLE
ncbi:MAG TPA: hypothetical protein VM243_15165 [Phycisphaerae bacterium]|nr:hypothetical protein [Phycisphaerae bacterium]